MQEREVDEDIDAINTSTPTQVQIHGPITRACARQLNYQVSSFLSSCSSYLNHGNPCTSVLLRNNGEEPEGRGFARGVFGLQNSTNLWWSPRLHMEMDWGVQALHKKLTKSTFERIQPHPHIFLAWATIVKLL